MGRALITVTDNTGKIVSAIDVAISTCKDWRPVWRKLRAPWRASRRRMFQTQGRSTGTPWPSYARTPERRQYRYIKAKITGVDVDNLKPLHWENGSERLRPSLIASRHPNQIWRATKQRLTAGTNAPGAKNHNRGIGRSPNWRNLRSYRIPKRPLLAFGRDFLSAVSDAVGQHAATIAAEATGRTRVGYSSRQVRRLLGGR